MNTSTRPARGRQAAPTKPEISNALFGIRQAATAGSLPAMIALVFVAKADEQAVALKALRDDVGGLALAFKAESMRRLNDRLHGEFAGALGELKTAMLAAVDAAAPKQ
jgi:hypothetical protein